MDFERIPPDITTVRLPFVLPSQSHRDNIDGRSVIAGQQCATKTESRIVFDVKNVTHIEKEKSHSKQVIMNIR